MYEKTGVIINRVPDKNVVKHMDLGGLDVLSVIESDSRLAQCDIMGGNVFELPDDSLIVEGAREALKNIGIIE